MFIFKILRDNINCPSVLELFKLDLLRILENLLYYNSVILS